MADVKMIATRESYGNTLKALAAEGHDDLVVLDADLAAATKTGVFRKAYPDRHFDCGIAEALSLIHISEPTRRTPISYAVFCLKKKNKQTNKQINK